jgi:hypothetical protein
MGLPGSHVRFLSSLIAMALGYLLKRTGYCKETDGEALVSVRQLLMAIRSLITSSPVAG